LHGKLSGGGTQLRKRIRNGFLITLLISSVIVSTWDFLPTAVINKVAKSIRPDLVDQLTPKQDSLLKDSNVSALAPHLIVRTERQIIDSLLAQIDFILNEQNDDEQKLKRSAQYLLLPLPDESGFFLALDHEPTDTKTNLSLYNSDPSPAWFNPQHFLGVNKQIDSFICSLQNEEIKYATDSIGKFSTGRIQDVFYLLDSDNLHCGFGNYSYASFQEDLNDIYQLHSIKLPLALLNSEIRQYLFTPDDNKISIPILTSEPDAQNYQTDNNESICKLLGNAETKLVSLQILEAFCYQDILLSFNLERLEKFRQLLGIYRQLLDGRQITDLLSSPATVGSTIAVKPTFLDLQSTHGQLFLLLVVLIILLLGSGPISRNFISLFRAIVNRRYLNLYHEANKFIELLSYSSTQQDNRSLGFKGLSLGQTHTHTTRDLTLPGLTAHYLAFVELIREQYNGKVVFVIDELDKVHDPDQVKALLTEIKGALFSKGCFYLISISEDAARSFRYRLTSGRDIFESTFDEIIEIRQMDVQSGSAMLDKRAEYIDVSDKLPQPCLELLVLFGGGIPREIIRGSRTLTLMMDTMSEPAFSWAARQLLHEEISNWISHFGEINLNGEETVKLRDCAQLALVQFNSLEKTTKPDYSQVSAHLQSCLKIVDPENLRKSVGFIANIKDQDDSRASKYEALVSDIQACLRLIILATIAELTEKTGNDWKQYDSAILDCHHALADKPALTETLLKELRSEHGLAEDV